ncbi:MAG TPA: PD-(D/E)XK nuclease family protein, partial [Chitinophagales bacterium]|nr:PD-(D/E)XK nuclease family protein [Chitinophagales bacterium]
LQRYFNEVRETGNFPPPEKLVQPFRLYMQQHREAFTDKQFRNRMELGEMILPEYYAQHVSSWNKVVVTEYPVRDVTWKNIPINGKLDKIEFNGNEVHVVDYKTGSYRLAKQKMKGPTDKDPLGGEYWRQMVFYQILMDQQRQKPWRMVSGEFDFLEKNPDSGKYEKERLVITSDDTAIVGRQIEEVYGKIRSLDFTEGCNEPDCEYCNLLKYE